LKKRITRYARATIGSLSRQSIFSAVNYTSTKARIAALALPSITKRSSRVSSIVRVVVTGRRRGGCGMRS
jgi:hypothetical protein